MFYLMVRHHMRSYTDKPPPISTFELLGVYVMPMTRIRIKTNLLVRVENVFLLSIRLERKVGDLTWKTANILFQGM